MKHPETTDIDVYILPHNDRCIESKGILYQYNKPLPNGRTLAVTEIVCRHCHQPAFEDTRLPRPKSRIRSQVSPSS